MSATPGATTRSHGDRRAASPRARQSRPDLAAWTLVALAASKAGKAESATRRLGRFACSALLLATLALLASPAAAVIQGRVFEDVNYGGGAGRSFGASLGVLRGGARVELYDNTGAFVAFQITDAAGVYTFPQSGPGTYTVRVVNSTVTSSRTLPVVAGLLPVQTFRTDASSGVVPVTDRVGGEVPSLVDAGPNTTGLTLAQLTTPTTTAQSITTVTFGAPPNINNVNFGFNFNTIVNVNDSGQGSLRQFLLNSNALGNAMLAIVGQPAGRDVSVFMISDGLAHAGLRAGLANLLSGAGVAVITPVTALPAMTDADTSVDGSTQTANVGDTNAVVLGTGGTVGVDGLVLSTVAGPEVEISGSGTLANGLLIQAANAVVRGLAIHGFGTAAGEGGVRVDTFSNALIENNVLGSTATSFTDPGFAQRNQSGVYSNGGNNSTVRNNLIGFSRVVGVDLNAGTAGWTITGNEIRDSGMDQADGDGITINASTTNTSSGNLVTGSSSQGIVVTVAGATGNVFTNNTVTGNGVGIPSGLVQSPGIVLRSGAASTVLDRNVVRANYGAGVQANNGSTGTRLTRNSFALNGTITARNGGAATGQIGIDLNSPADNIHLGTAPFYTLNDAGDVDTGANGLLNFPVLVWASLYGGNLRIGGYARPGSVIELFVASPDPTGFGEGTTYLITLTEGGTGAGGNDPYADLDAGTGTYGPGPINGRAQGTDTTNRFAFIFPVPAGVGVGTPLTATATLGGETSEFSGNVTVSAVTAVELVSFEAAPSDGAVELSWRTGSELNNLGFHLYRSLSAEGPWERITASLIPGLGSSPEGARYGYRDTGLLNGATYFYQLEDVETTGRTERHGPVWATPEPGVTEQAEVEDPDEQERSEAEDPTRATGSWIRYGDPEATSWTVTERGPEHVVVELQTGGFWARPDSEGGVWLSIPGFEERKDPGAPALPVRQAWLEAVAGRKVRLASVVGRDVVSFDGLRPAVAGEPELWEDTDGTLRPGVRRRPAGRAFQAAGLHPEKAARVVGTAFQGEEKKVQLELTPLRWDRSAGRLLLARRLRVKLVFAGREAGERALGGARGRAERGRQGRGGEGVVARLAVEAPGLYGVRFEEVSEGRGWSLSELSLSHQGEAVAFHAEPEGRRFGPGSVLFFESAGGASNPYGRAAVYELSLAGNGVRMPIASAAPAGGSVSWYWQRDELEVNRLYQPTLFSAPDRWLWDYIPSRRTKAYAFPVSGLVDAAVPGRLELWLQGASDYPADPDHHVRVSVNGQAVAEASWDGKQPYALEAALESTLLREGENSLEITNLGDTGASYSLVVLDRFAVSHPRATVAQAGTLAGHFPDRGTATVEGVGPGTWVLDTTETSPRWLVGAVTTSSGVSFAAESGRRYHVTSPDALRRPGVRRVVPSTLRDETNRGDYLVVGPRELLAAAEPLVEHRRDQGLESRAVAIEDVYDEFGFGEESPEALRDFLTHAYHHWELGPRYVLLLGDATFDFKNHLNAGVVNQVPPYMVRDAYMWTVSDPAYAAVNGEDLLPDFALGRLPAEDLGQARSLVQKVLTWERSGFDLSGRAVLAADNSDRGGDFEGDAERLAQTVLAERSPERIYLSRLKGATRATILDSFDRGSSLYNYVGHGSVAIWASENVFNIWDVPNLAPQAQQPLLLTMNCLNGYFTLPSGMNSLGEELLKAEGKGVIGAFSPSSLSLHHAARVYHEAFVSEIVSGQHERLGDALVAAQAAYLESGASPDLLSIYQLLGDPALGIR